MNASLQDQLNQWKQDHIEAKKQGENPNRQPPSKKKDKLSDSDLRYLMGTSRSVHKRVKGRIKQN